MPGPRRRSMRRKAPRRRAAPFRCRLVVMAKVPVAGGVKTRLAREIGVAGATRFARHAAAALLQRVGVRPALADHRLPLRPTAAWRAASGRAAWRACRKAAAISAARMQRIFDCTPRGAGADRRHRRAGHQAGAHRRGVPPARPPRCRVRPGGGRRLLAGRPAAAPARAAALRRASAGRARTRSPTRWPISRAAPWPSSRR